MQKKFGYLVSVFILLILVAACGGGGSETSQGNTGGAEEGTESNEPIVIRYAHNQHESTPQHEGTVLFKEKIEELSEGRIEVQIYPNNQLGSLRETIESVQAGQIELAQQPIGMISNFVPEMTLNDLPYLFPSEEVLWAVLDGEGGQMYDSYLENQGFVGLGYMSGGPKQFSAHKPLRTTDDFAGTSIRAMEAPIVISTMEALGANPVPIAFSELYNSLQQEVVDGQENPNQSFVMLNLHEVQDVVTMTNHSWMIYNNIMNKDFYESLPADLQELVREAMEYANDEQRLLMQAEEESYISELEELGTEVVHLTDEEIEALRQATLPVYDEFKDVIGDELMQSFLGEIESLSSN
ncbi:TRAP transporter substrate-binding protein [Alkalihalobacillus oceani]|uniref:TRAP transporter substrate-binding protein n=1 Tax=Halalkalibacter oceani TaxID=1653776 RepID=UPI00203B6355|nr:TRAP transporter substrate-binding protein [Halalkalibacter oceani]MCM3760944.1 TRAP transporter substrate-binding protein [Halalkalibacter oceani]